MGRAARWPLVAAVGIASLFPVGILVVRALGSAWMFPALLPGRYDLASWTTLAGTRLWRSAATGLVLALGTGLLGAAFALPAGRTLSRLTGWRRSLGAAAAFLPVAAPPVALGTGLQLCILSIGLGNSLPGVLLAHLVPATGYLSLYFLGVFTAFDSGLEDEARSLGATPAALWRRVLLPLLGRPIAQAVALGFLVSWAQVPLTLLVGGGQVLTLPVEVFSFLQSGQDRVGAAGALLLMVPGLVALSGAALVAQRESVVAV